MAIAGTVQEKTRDALVKAEDTIRELEKTIAEKPREKISPWLIGAALGSIAGALVLYAKGRKEDATFVGLWAPTFLALGIFKDILKLPGRD